MNLIEITKDLKTLQDLVGEDLTEEQQKTLDILSIELMCKMEQKAESIVQLANSLECDLDQIDAEIKRLQALKKSRKKKAKALKEFLIYAMEQSNLNEVNTPTMNIKLRKIADKIVVEEPEKLSEEFLRIPEPKPAEPDKKALLDSFKKTGVIPAGCKVETNRHSLNIK